MIAHYVQEALHRDKRDSAQKAAQRQGKKIAMGQAALTLLIKGFVKTGTSDKLRRWIGILALELLKDCRENTEKLQSDPPKEKHWHSLSEVIEHGSCQVLKLIAGSMIREMLSFGVSPDDFWKSKTHLDLYLKFPKSQHHNSQWVTSFEEFVDELVLGKILTQEVSSVIFAQAVYVGDRKWDLKEASDILVTLYEDLNIIVPERDDEPAVYIDVPFNAITKVYFDELVTESQQTTYGLVIQLMGGSAANCILNATGCAARHVALAFASEKDANTLRRLLMPANVRTNGFSPRSQSRAIDVSEPILSEDELAAPNSALSNSQILMRTASLASAIIPHRYTVSTIDPSKLERTRGPQRASAEHQEGSSSPMVEDDEDSHRVGHVVEMAEEGINVSDSPGLVEQAIEGIDVSETDDLRHEETQHRESQALAPEKSSYNAQVRYSQQAASSVEPVETRSHFEVQHGEYDDLYDASPIVKDSRRRSPRLIARNNSPQKLERPLESTAPQPWQASLRTGPPNKLSRRLRDANGVMEPRREQRADDHLAASTKASAGNVRTSAKSNKGKAPVPTKMTTVPKESTKTSKKMTQSKVKAVATEEPFSAGFDSYDLPQSPTRVKPTTRTSENKKKATPTRPKTTKAPRNNQKQAKPKPIKAAGTTSMEGSAPNLKKGFKNDGKANGSIQDSAPKEPSAKEVDVNDDTIWDVGEAHREEEPQILRQSRQPAKAAKKQDVRGPKTEKGKAQGQLRADEATANKATKARNHAPISRIVKAKPTPATLSRPRSRRAAAIKANKKIQELDESDEILDEEGIVPPLMRDKRQISLETAKAPKTQNARGSRDGRRDGPKSNGKIPATKFSTKDSVPDSVSPDSSDKQIPNSVVHPRVDSSPEKVNLIRAASVEALRAAPGDMKDSLQMENLTSAAETSVIPQHSGHKNHSDQANPTSVDNGVEVSEASVILVPDSVPQLHETITETEPTLTRAQQDDDVHQEHDDLGSTKSAGPGDKKQVEQVLPYIDDASLGLRSQPDMVKKEAAPPQNPAAPIVAEVRQRRTSPRFVEAARKSLLESTGRKRDPFGLKLNALIPAPKDINAKVKGREVLGDAIVDDKRLKTPKSAELATPSREPKVRLIDRLRATSFEEAKQIKNPRKHLRSGMQIDGEGEDSLMQTLKPASDSISASWIETKRKTEEVGATSHKRVKWAPPEQLEGASAKRKPASSAKKTPTPVVSNRPLVIGFSSTGPRNQGTISAKKPELPKDVETGRPDAVELCKNDARNPTISQVEAGFASVGKALQIPSEGVQHDLKTADDVQPKVRDSPQQKGSEHLEIVNVVAAQKRKLAPFLDEPAPGEHEQLSKRRKQDIETPPTAHSHRPAMLPDISPAVVHDRSQRLSSQNTRVNENGSPMPFYITHNDDMAAEEQLSDEDDGKDALAEARLEEQRVLQDDDFILPEPILPLRPPASAISAPQTRATAYQSLSNNIKQVPSSPHAPSAFGTMPPHHVYHSGEIVNVETNESIIPVKPQDPFLGATQKPQSSFMEALRKSTEIAAKRAVHGVNKKRGPDGVVMRQALNVVEDPDKTLVEPNLSINHRHVHVSDNSSSSQSGSSTQVSEPDESSEEEGDTEAEAKWRKQLEPHQENMLECLLKISHVSSEV